MVSNYGSWKKHPRSFDAGEYVTLEWFDWLTTIDYWNPSTTSSQDPHNRHRHKSLEGCYAKEDFDHDTNYDRTNGLERAAS